MKISQIVCDEEEAYYEAEDDEDAANNAGEQSELNETLDLHFNHIDEIINQLLHSSSEEDNGEEYWYDD